jgi:replicative DNA helicase
MKWLDITEICMGLVLAEKLTPEQINPEFLAPPYGTALKMLQKGSSLSDLYDVIGISALDAAQQAGTIVSDKSPFDFVTLLEKAYSRAELAKTLKHQVKRLDDGDDADLLVLEQAMERNVSLEHRYILMSDISPDENVWIPTYYEPIDRSLGGVPKGGLTIIAAPPGCLDGDTMVGINRAGKSFQISMRDLEYKIHGGYTRGSQWDMSIETKIRTMSDDGFIRLSPLKSVLYSGKKQVYNLLLKSGKAVIGTYDHPVYTDKGWKCLGHLCKGDFVYAESSARVKKNKHTKLTYEEVEGLQFHPYHHTHSMHINTVAKHRLVMEAHINNVPLDKWISMGRSGYDKNDYIFIPLSTHVHHIDGNSKNNNPSNLEMLTEREHCLKHSEKNWKNVSYYVDVDEVVSVTYIGERDTYDIEVCEEHPNFLANGIVVHNTGKTSLALKIAIAAARQKKKTLFYTFEMTKGQLKKRTIDILRDMSASEIDELQQYIEVCSEIMDPYQVKAEATRKAAIEDISYIMIDFADLMLAVAEEEAQVALLYRTMATLAQSTEIPVILLSQLNRSYVEKGGIPRIYNIRWSGLAEAMAALILLIYNPRQVYGAKPTSTGEDLHLPPGAGALIVGKSRFGTKYDDPVGAIYVPWDGELAWGDKMLQWQPLSVV